MPNRKIPFLKDNFYHVFSRGNRKSQIFFEPSDYLRFLKKAQEYKNKYQVAVIVFCLLPNHFHLLLKQLAKVPLSQFMGTLLNSFSRFISVKYHLPTGHVFQGRFGARHLDNPSDLLQVSRYIHLNPIKENIFQLDFTWRKGRKIQGKELLTKLRNYPWSSFPSYLGSQKSDLEVNIDPIIEIERNLKKYQKFVESKITEGDLIILEDY